MSCRPESRLEIPRAGGAFDLIPRVTGINGARGGGRHLEVGFLPMVTCRIFVALFGVIDRMDQHDEGAAGKEQDSDDD